MGRGKIEIKRIENPTNRQVTFSKRRVGILKKARELSVLCDAEVSLIMFSNSGKLSEYCTPSTSIKSILDRYQHISGINLWSSHYQKMKSHLNKLQDENERLRKEIRHTKGEDLVGLSFNELRGLEHSIDEYLKVVSEKKIRKIVTQIDTCKKKVRSALEQHKLLLRETTIDQDPQYSLYDSETDFEPALGLGNGHQQLEYHLQPNNHQAEVGDDIGYNFHDLRLG